MILFILSSIISFIKIREREKMTFPKIRNIEDLIKKSNKVLFFLFVILFEFRKNAHFSKLHLGPK